MSGQGRGVDEVHDLKRGIRKELQGALKGAILVIEGAFLAADLRGLCWPKEGVTKLAGSLVLERANLDWLDLMLPHLKQKITYKTLEHNHHHHRHVNHHGCSYVTPQHCALSSEHAVPRFPPQTEPPMPGSA